MVGIAILNNTEGEGHLMLGIVAINREHEEGWRACVGVQEKKKNIPMEWWMQACGHVNVLCVRVTWISVKKKKDKKRLTRTQMSAKKKKKNNLLGMVDMGMQTHCVWWSMRWWSTRW